MHQWLAVGMAHVHQMDMSIYASVSTATVETNVRSFIPRIFFRDFIIYNNCIIHYCHIIV